MTGKEDGIPPSECTSILRVDINGNVRTDVNTAAVIPRAPAAGYISPGVKETILHEGPGTGRIDVHVVNPDSVKDSHTYRITFENPTPFQNHPNPYFRFSDETNGRVLIERRQVLSVGEETDVVDGMIGYVFNDSKVEIVKQQTRWVSGVPNIVTAVDLDPGAGFAAVNVRYPADFELRFSNTVVDTSTTGLFFGAPSATPTKFTFWNLTENSKAQFLFYDADSDSAFSIGDRIIIVYGDSLGKRARAGSYRTTWSVRMFVDSLALPVRLPGPGDVLKIATTKPFRTSEAFQFTMRGHATDKGKARGDLDRIAVVPNPYAGAASWEPQNLFRSGRGERRIYFVNLPAKCTIRIYTVRGHLVQEINREAAVDDGQEAWNLVSKDGMDVAYGIYIYHVEASGIGEKIGRFAVIK